ncbi:PREDICTED: nucleolin-like [Priapulus caudatus]|uniref:Nucleolin-like n=1 Tax=Priapulus caudatus TaxID=37621 RepID=A0ABM1EQJ7_PRICU|nr:PREDICTED: nucleolin-like [Priapulus caudatus]
MDEDDDDEHDADEDEDDEEEVDEDEDDEDDGDEDEDDEETLDKDDDDEEEVDENEDDDDDADEDVDDEDEVDVDEDDDDDVDEDEDDDDDADEDVDDEEDLDEDDGDEEDLDADDDDEDDGDEDEDDEEDMDEDEDDEDDGDEDEDDEEEMDEDEDDSTKLTVPIPENGGAIELFATLTNYLGESTTVNHTVTIDDVHNTVTEIEGPSNVNAKHMLRLCVRVSQPKGCGNTSAKLFYDWTLSTVDNDLLLEKNEGRCIRVDADLLKDHEDKILEATVIAKDTQSIVIGTATKEITVVPMPLNARESDQQNFDCNESIKDVSNRQKLTITNFPPGNYQFKLVVTKGSRQSETEVDVEVKDHPVLKIRIKPQHGKRKAIPSKSFVVKSWIEHENPLTNVTWRMTTDSDGKIGTLYTESTHRNAYELTI